MGVAEREWNRQDLADLDDGGGPGQRVWIESRVKRNVYGGSQHPRNPARSGGRHLEALVGWDVLTVGSREWFNLDAVIGTVVLGPAPSASEATAPQRDLFEQLVKTWVADTMLSSSTHQICTHWAYQRVIGMGQGAVPLILEEVAAGGRHWGWALAAITGENPAESTESPKAAADAWLAWGEERGFDVRSGGMG